MRVTIVSDRDGTIRAMANCQLIVGDKRYPDEAEILASPPRTGASSEFASREAEEFECHTVELPEYLVGKGLEDLREFAYLDLSGVRPMLRPRTKSEES